MGEGQAMVAAARALQPVVRAHAEQAQALRHAPEPVVRAMADAGLYRLAAPACFGGAEADPISTIEAIEAISEADGSIGWVLMIGIETVGIGGSLMEPDMAAGLFAEHPDLVMCGALNPQGRARPVEGGWLVSGRWPFASGCHHATFFWGQCVVEGSTPTRLIEVLVPRADYEILDTWHDGPAGTGSHDVQVQDLFVPAEMVTEVAGRSPRHDGPLYRLPPFSRLAYNKVGVATGIARAALDSFVELAEHKVPRLSSRPLRERSRAQRNYAEAEAALRGAGVRVRGRARRVGDGVRRRPGRPPAAGAGPPRLLARLPGSDPGGGPSTRPRAPAPTWRGRPSAGPDATWPWWPSS
ncbi:MAG: acyl-CoA dehydrogenase family protein [Acidimicrobiales bacterium]